MATSLIKPEDQEALPSYVQSIQSSENYPVASWESVKKFITEDPIVKNLTLLYRQRLQVSKSFADELKPKCPAITISAQMDGYGRKLTNFLKPTLKLMVEFDTVPGDQMEHIKQLIVKDEHTMVVHRSISGRGFHIFCKYSPSDNEDVAILDLFHLMLEKAQSYYEHLLGLECDKACADITRCAGLAYDLEAFFNWQSVPFSLDNGDLKKFYTQKAVEAKSLKRAANRKAKREQPAVYHRRGEPPLLSLDSGQHRESDRLPDRLRPRLCRGIGSGSGGDEAQEELASELDILADSR